MYTQVFLRTVWQGSKIASRDLRGLTDKGRAFIQIYGGSYFNAALIFVTWCDQQAARSSRATPDTERSNTTRSSACSFMYTC